jgi:hypothetical protein
MNNPDFIEGDGDDFTQFLFSSEPKEKGSIRVDFGEAEDHSLQVIHIFQELLMIFTDGMKYLFSQDNGFSITILTSEDIELMNRYLESIGFQVLIETFTVYDYLDNMKLPNYFLHKEEITSHVRIDELYYETYLHGIIYRVSFKYIL